MDKTKNLYVFGYGLSLLIPFLVVANSLHLGFSYLKLAFFLTCFFGILFIVSKMADMKIKGSGLFDLCIFPVQAAAFYFLIKHEPSIIKLLLLMLAGLVFCITLKDADLLEPLYKKWMAVAHFIGSIVNGAILIILYYFVFGLIGIVLRLTGKDHLDKKLDSTKASYWVKREQKPFDKTACEKQF